MTLENNRPPLLCCFKLCASLRRNWWIQTGVTLRKRQFGQHQALCIISSSYVNSNWSYSPEMVKLDFDLCDLDLLHGPHFWSLVITHENFMMMRWWENSEQERQGLLYVKLIVRACVQVVSRWVCQWQRNINLNEDIISNMHERVTWPHWVKSLEYKIQGVWIIRNSH